MRFLSSSSTQHGESLDVSLESKAVKGDEVEGERACGVGLTEDTPRGCCGGCSPLLLSEARLPGEQRGTCGSEGPGSRSLYSGLSALAGFVWSPVSLLLALHIWMRLIKASGALCGC